jgi:hypothetical protein
MAGTQRTIKEIKTPAQKKQPGLASAMSQIDVDALFETGLKGEFLKRGAWLFLLLIAYIGNNHWANKFMYQLNKTKEQAEDLRVDYTTIKHEYMFRSKQSEVAKSMEAVSIVESNVPPRKIKIEVQE